MQRLYVLTWEKEKVAYEAIYNRFQTYRMAGNLREIENLRIHCENQIKDEIRQALTEEFKEKPEEIARVMKPILDADPLLLVDIPIKSVSTSIGTEHIWFISEDATEMKGAFFSAPQALDDAPFDKAVGKIRVFVPPELTSLLLRHLPDHHARITEILRS
jgi:hypothetical protein